MKSKPIALALSMALILATLAGCSAHTAKVATTSPRAGIIGVLDREAEQIRTYISRQNGDIARNTTTRAPDMTPDSPGADLSARHLTALIGLFDGDVRHALGQSRPAGTMAQGQRYNQMVYGSDTELYVTYDDNDKVDKVVITVDEDDAARWRRELNDLYGVQVDQNTASTSQWLDKNAHINWTQTGDKVRITITGKTL